MPSKLTGMLASAHPVVPTAHLGTDLALVVQTSGLVVPPANAAALAQAIQTLAGDPALRESLGAAGYLYAQAHLDSEAVLERFEADFQELVGGLGSVARLGV
jgi:colanic acid biosynthesis glycosyl transferase WcaI